MRKMKHNKVQRENEEVPKMKMVREGKVRDIK
jgi:hypothetical protein